nr:venom protein [Lampona murina]
MLWVLAAFVLSVARADANPVRMCVPADLEASCTDMARDHPETFVCVVAPDTFGCLEKITSGEADLTNVDPNGLYLAGKYFNLKPIVTELVDGQPYRYQGIALVAKDDSSIQSASDLRGKRSCHTGFRRTVGWQIPVSQLLHKNVMEPSCDEGELAAVKNFFGGSCLPGNWSTDPVVDRALKDRYPSLCSQCKDPATCAADDPHAGYEGVIKCLEAGHADVAFTKIPVLREYLTKHPELAEKAELLCFDGGRKGVNDEEPCVWGERPTNVYVARANHDEETERLVTAMLNTQSRYVTKVRTPEWYYKTFLTHPKVSGIRATEENRRTYITYLGDFLHTIRKPRPGCSDEERQYDVNFCVTSEEEEYKCQDYSKAAESRGLWPDVRCVRAASKAACMETLKNGHGHLLVLDGGDIYKGGRYFGLLPVAGELYNGSDATYYAVAVQRSISDVTKLSELRGVRSCHTGMGRTAGWVMPLGALLSEGLLSPEDGTCNHAASVADFFSGGSCVPGANDTKYNPGRVRSEDLCRQCVGDEEGLHRCARDSSERYSGYGGAFRCLAEGKGDVAFVRHSTVDEHTDGRSELPWTSDLVSSDFQLLCGESGTAPVDEYLNCNLGKVPSHHVVTNGETPFERRLQFGQLLGDTSRYFADDSKLFKLFTKRHDSDLLFKDSATGLKVTPFDATYEQVLGRRFLEASTAVDPKNCA